MGLVWRYDAKPQGFQPGGCSLHNMMLPHGPDREAFENASNAELRPHKHRHAWPSCWRLPAAGDRLRRGLDGCRRTMAVRPQLRLFDPTRREPLSVRVGPMKRQPEGRARRPVGRRRATSPGGERGRDRPPCSTPWRTAEVEPGLRQLASRLEAGTAEAPSFRRDRLRLALATRLSMGRRLGLRHPCRAGQEGARRRAARAVLDRSAHVSGRLGQLRRPARPILATSEDWGVDLEAEVAVITDDVPMGTPAALAGRHIKLVLLVNDVTARPDPRRARQGLRLPARQARQRLLAGGRDADELGTPGRARLHLPLLSFINGKPFGKPDAGTDMTFDFAR